MLKTSPTIVELLEGCKAFGVDFAEWSIRRRFISTYIERGGTILDVGCGSGLLIFCLARWSGKTLTPFGVDQDHRAVELARCLFPGCASNFKIGDYEIICACHPCDWPKFDYIFWNIPNSWTADRCGTFTRVLRKMVATRGKVILAQYGMGDRATDLEIQASRWIEITAGGIEFERVVWNDAGIGQSIAVVLTP